VLITERASMALLDIVKCDRNVSRENDGTTSSWKNVLQMFYGKTFAKMLRNICKTFLLQEKGRLYIGQGEARAPFPRFTNSIYCILAYLFTAMLYDDTSNVILCLWVVFSFNGFNRFTWFNMGRNRRITKNDRRLT